MQMFLREERANKMAKVFIELEPAFIAEARDTFFGISAITCQERHHEEAVMIRFTARDGVHEGHNHMERDMRSLLFPFLLERGNLDIVSKCCIHYSIGTGRVVLWKQDPTVLVFHCLTMKTLALRIYPEISCLSQKGPLNLLFTFAGVTVFHHPFIDYLNTCNCIPGSLMAAA